MSDKSLIYRMVVAHTITPEAWLAITEAEFKYDLSHWAFQYTHRIGDEWRICFRAHVNGKTWHVGSVYFFELLDGTIIA